MRVEKLDGNIDYVTNSTAFHLVDAGRYERITNSGTAIRELPEQLQPKPIFPWKIKKSGNPGIDVWQMITA